jgi:hypothetical protein
MVQCITFNSSRHNVQAIKLSDLVWHTHTHNVASRIKDTTCWNDKNKLINWQTDDAWMEACHGKVPNWPGNHPSFLLREWWIDKVMNCWCMNGSWPWSALVSAPDKGIHNDTVSQLFFNFFLWEKNLLVDARSHFWIWKSACY